MTYKQFQRVLDRDQGRCLHCGTTDGLVPNHRANRGMGGRESMDVAANVITLCGLYNAAIEANQHYAAQARALGLKLWNWEFQDRLLLPVYDRMAQQWFFLNDQYGRTAVD